MSIMRFARPGGPRVLLTHATEDTIVPFASAANFHRARRAVAAAFRRAGSQAAEEDADEAEDGAGGLQRADALVQGERPVGEKADDAGGDHDWVAH